MWRACVPVSWAILRTACTSGQKKEQHEVPLKYKGKFPLTFGIFGFGMVGCQGESQPVCFSLLAFGPCIRSGAFGPCVWPLSPEVCKRAPLQRPPYTRAARFATARCAPNLQRRELGSGVERYSYGRRTATHPASGNRRKSTRHKACRYIRPG